MLKTQKLVHDMMVALNLPLPNEEKPGVTDLNFELLRSLVAEEAKEFDMAMLALSRDVNPRLADRETMLHSWADVVDAMCGLIVVVHNTANAMGLDLEPFFEEVHRTNMKKVGGPVRADGKALKPLGWGSPRLMEMLVAVMKRARSYSVD